MAEPVETLLGGEQARAEREGVAMTLDVTDLPCPIPVLKAQKALKGLASGETLEVLASDPAADADMTALCLTLGHRLVERCYLSGGDPPLLRFLIQKS